MVRQKGSMEGSIEWLIEGSTRRLGGTHHANPRDVPEPHVYAHDCTHVYTHVCAGVSGQPSEHAGGQARRRVGRPTKGPQARTRAHAHADTDTNTDSHTHAGACTCARTCARTCAGPMHARARARTSLQLGQNKAAQPVPSCLYTCLHASICACTHVRKCLHLDV